LITEQSRTYNSRLAQELGKWAEAQGHGNEFHQAVYRAFFVDGVNIALVDELVQIAAAVDADWQRAMELHITAVPTHLCGGKRLSGFAAFEDFVHLIGKRR